MHNSKALLVATLMCGTLAACSSTPETTSVKGSAPMDEPVPPPPPPPPPPPSGGDKVEPIGDE